ncbi:hypothetical protein F1D05_23815 [Kribbella qitaiheensis]|uniref:Uncharacterized protein n=1 Tax=Kribbella qitaiheensis TaxID=1544730 RepID=A0A7G6X2B7_9ACTN|nr:DUF6247 family protein [Kribbella qitaiheensis]QNE20382.1 hypothetical protein F1D05_23815 [Kribbella qitaiheensis]
MTAQPLPGPGDDPAEILRVLPAEWHEQFLSEYHEALEAAHEVWRFRQLQDVLHLWHLRATAFSKPGFALAEQATREGRAEEFTPAEEVIPGWADRP